MGITPEQMKGLMGVIDKYVASQKPETDSAQASLLATPESQDSIDAKDKAKKEEAAKMFNVPYPIPGVAFDTFFVDEVKKSVDAITKTASKPMEAISSFTGLLQLEGQLANFLSAIAEGTFANEDVRAMVTNGLKSYITSYIATMILDKEGNVLKAISNNALPSTAQALLDKIRTQVAVPRAPIQSIAKAPAVQHGEVPKAAPSALSKMYTSVKEHTAAASSHIADKASQAVNAAGSVATQALAKHGIVVPAAANAHGAPPAAPIAAAPIAAATAAAEGPGAPAAPKSMFQRGRDNVAALGARAKKAVSRAEIVEPEARAGPSTEIEKLKQNTARTNELAAAKPAEKLALQQKHASEDLAAAKHKTETLKAELEKTTDPAAYAAKEAELAEHENVVKGRQDDLAATSRAYTKKTGSYLNAAAMNTTDFVRGTRRTANMATDMVGAVQPGAPEGSDRQRAMARARDVLSPLTKSMDHMADITATTQLNDAEVKEIKTQKETRNKFGSDITATQQSISQKMRDVAAATQAIETLQANPTQDAVVVHQLEVEKDNKKEAEDDIKQLKATLKTIKGKLAAYNESKLTKAGGTKRRRVSRNPTQKNPRRARPKKTKARPRRRATARRGSKRNQTAKGRTRFTSEDMLF